MQIRALLVTHPDETTDDAATALIALAMSRYLTTVDPCPEVRVYADVGKREETRTW